MKTLISLSNRVGTVYSIVVAFSSRARILRECLPALFSFFSPLLFSPLFLKVEISSHTLIPLYARISPQWLSDLRRLWPSFPRRVACELVSWSVPTPCLDSDIVSPLQLRECSINFGPSSSTHSIQRPILSDCHLCQPVCDSLGLSFLIPILSSVRYTRIVICFSQCPIH